MIDARLNLLPSSIAELLRSSDEAFSLLLRLRKRQLVADAPEIVRLGMALQVFGSYPRDRESLARRLDNTSDSTSGVNE